MSALGFFDSGLGGLTVLCQVRSLLPDLDLVYLADQAHVPYGGRTTEDLTHLLAANVAWLNEAGASTIVGSQNMPGPAIALPPVTTVPSPSNASAQ